MATFVLILLLIAATFGVLGAVLKVALVLVLSVILAIVVLTAIVAWYVRSGVHAWQRDLRRRAEDERRRSHAYDVGREDPHRGSTGELGGGAD